MSAFGDHFWNEVGEHHVFHNWEFFGGSGVNMQASRVQHEHILRCNCFIRANVLEQEMQRKCSEEIVLS